MALALTTKLGKIPTLDGSKVPADKKVYEFGEDGKFSILMKSIKSLFFIIESNSRMFAFHPIASKSR